MRMFLNKIGGYKKFILAHKDLKRIVFIPPKVQYVKTFYTVNGPQKSLSVTVKSSTHVSECSYSTVMQPKMTATMQRWKKKKRKSKTQQKKEMEQLQKDLVKILTKRAVQLVQNKSLLNAQHKVILTHAFTDLSCGNGRDFLSVISSETGESLSPLKFINKSDFIAHQVETLINPYQVNNRLPVSSAQRLVPQQAVKTEDTLQLSGPAEATINNAEQKPLFADIQNKHSRTLQGACTYLDLFPENKKNAVTDSNLTDFKGNYRKFVKELESVKEKNSKVFQNWTEESQNVVDAEKTVHSHKAQIKTKLSAPLKKVMTSESSRIELLAEKNFNSVKEQTAVFNELPVRLTSSLIIPPSFITSHNSAPVDPFYDYHVADGEADEAAEDLNSVKTKNGVAEAVKTLQDGKEQAVDAAKETLKMKTTSGQTKHKKHSKVSNMNVSNELQELLEKSFVDACCFSKNVLLAVRNLQYLSLKQKISSVEVFNKLIHALAKKKDLKTVKNLFAMIHKQNLTPTLQTYAACLECFGRMNKFDSAQCEKLISDAKNRGLDMAELANQCSFESDELHFVIKAISSVEPTFQLNPPNYEMKYKHELLTQLNDPNEKAVEKNPYAIAMDKSTMAARTLAQLEMEQKGEVMVTSIHRTNKGGNTKMKNLQKEVMENWHQVLLKTFNERITTLEKKAKDNGHMTLYPYLKLLPPEDYVNIIFTCLRDLFSSTEGYSPAQSTIKTILGQAVNRRYNIAYKTCTDLDEKILQLYKIYLDSYLDKDYSLDNHRCMWLRAMQQNLDTVAMNFSQKKWPGLIYREIGNFLLDMILYDLKINANLLRPSLPQRMVPAFSTIYRPDITMHSLSEIKLHPIVARLFKVDSIESFTFDPSIVPMLIPPVPWVSRHLGGLMLGSPSLIRMGHDIHHVDCLKSVNDSQFFPVLDSLNTLSACAWKINQPILDLQIEIFNNNGNPLLKISPPAAELPPLPTINADMSIKDKALVYKERLQLQQQKQDFHGLWCSDLYRLSIANKYRDEIFWFPHSVDFRGRTYPLPPHFNHLGSDNVRGMLLFAAGKPLGEKGFDWLKIHLVNLTGLKKRCSNQERLDFANDMMELILDSADNPMTGKKWWQNADEPWQTLACCMEIAKIERFSGRKEDYICHYPVHQDGSCNGLQHYAALGRDQAGAESVNLFPFHSPKDVYSDVVELVEKMRQKEAEQGNEIAKLLDGFVKRKVIKQTIMTTVYGVTRYGAKLQIHRQLKDIKDFPIDKAWPASIYLTLTTFHCLREMFSATKDIQDWLTELAHKFSALGPVDWVTPLGFPVLQPYFKKMPVADSKQDRYKPNTIKQKNAFPPNFIHSLDSTHMMLTSLYCMHAGITFVSVHDCFWTHACDVPTMNRICREQFVNMHRQTLLEDLSQHLIEQVNRYSQLPHLQEDLKDKTVPALLKVLSKIPKRGTFDLNNVLKSTYFFS